MSPTAIIFRDLPVVLGSIWFTVITLSGWGRPVLPRSGTVTRRCARVFQWKCCRVRRCAAPRSAPSTTARSTHGQVGDFRHGLPGRRVALITMDAPVIRVVVVDDHALHRDGTRQILDAHPDLQVVGDASSGEVALRLTRDHPDVRVLMVSAYDEDEYVRGALEAGAAGYLSKTAPGKELVQAVRAVARGTSVLQSGLTARLLISSRQPERGAAELSERELAVLTQLAAGMHNREIATHLSISTRTVDRHCDNIYAKLGVGSRTEAVVRAISPKLSRVGDGER